MGRTGTTRTNPTGARKISALPIDERIFEIVEAIASPTNQVVIVEAEPGAGKTTRLPPALLRAPFCKEKVFVTEPRRIAAKLSATRVAEEVGCGLGAEVGYRVRFEDRTGPETRLIYVTEGLLLRQILADPGLSGVSVVVLDEAHERSLDLDVLLALLKRALTKRNDLKLVIMSATLNVQAWQEYLPGSKYFECSGRSFAVSRHYQNSHDLRPLPIEVRSAIRSTLDEVGDILVFLPGAKEIRACQLALQELPGLEVLPLHGDLPLKAQIQAVSGGGTQKRVILSTNLAESSLTISGVTTVIDSGLARQKVFDPFSGVARLETVAISQARCEQRAGRAGRLAEGRVLRLFPLGDFQRRPAQDTPEILRADLAQMLLLLIGAKVSPAELSWLSPAPSSAWEKAQGHLKILGALTETTHGSKLSAEGHAMAAIPLPPRCARLLVESRKRGVGRRGALAAVLLAERDILQSSRIRLGNAQAFTTRTDSDLNDRLELFEQLEGGRFSSRLARELNIDLRAAEQVAKLVGVLDAGPNNDLSIENSGSLLTSCLLKAFPDWVACPRGSSKELLLSTGVQAALSEQSGVVDSPFILALSCDAPGGKRTRPLVRLACAISADILLSEANDQVETIEELRWNSEKNRVDEVSELRYGKLTLDAERREARPSPECRDILTENVLSRGPAVFDPEGRLAHLFVRFEVLRKCRPDLAEKLNIPETENRQGWEDLWRKAIHAMAEFSSNLTQIVATDLSAHFLDSLPAAQRTTLQHQVPELVTLRGGLALKVHYEQGRDPWIESRLQDFFSMTETPALCQGILPLSIQLLAPNRRAVQITSDLAGFWSRHYPDLRKQLMRRYPKHLWPEDGSTASPPQPGRIR